MLNDKIKKATQVNHGQPPNPQLESWDRDNSKEKN